MSSSCYYGINVRVPFLGGITPTQHSTLFKQSEVLLKPEFKGHIASTKTTEIPVQTNEMDSQEKFEMMTSGGHSLQFFLVSPQKVEFSQQFCPSCCCLYRHNIGFRGSHQPIQLVCGHAFCLGCVLTRVDSVRDPTSACDKCHPDTNELRQTSQ